MTAYAQSHESRISVEYNYVEPDGGNRAYITIEGGWSTYYPPKTLSFDPDLIAEALDANDDRISHMWGRITKLFEQMEKEAPRAIRRAKRRRRITRLP